MLLKTNPGIPKNRSDAFKNPRIILKNILALRKDPTIPKNTEPVSGNIYHGPLDQLYTGSIFAYLKSFRTKACCLGTLFLNNNLALL